MSGRWKVQYLAGLAALLLATAAHGDDYSGSYLCIQEFGGGVFFNETARSWQSTTFKPSGKLVLKVQLVGHTADPAPSTLVWDNYSVSLSEFDTGAPPTACAPFAASQGAIETIGPWINCQANLTLYRINLQAGRYLSAYLQGFVDGADVAGNTPAVFGGSCAKF